jgi:hypothetical protein
MDLQQLYTKLEKIDEKLDEHRVEIISSIGVQNKKIAVLEEKQRSTTGSIRLILGLVISSITGIISYVFNKLTQ